MFRQPRSVRIRCRLPDSWRKRSLETTKQSVKQSNNWLVGYMHIGERIIPYYHTRSAAWAMPSRARVTDIVAYIRTGGSRLWRCQLPAKNRGLCTIGMRISFNLFCEHIYENRTRFRGVRIVEPNGAPTNLAASHPHNIWKYTHIMASGNSTQWERNEVSRCHARTLFLSIRAAHL